MADKYEYNGHEKYWGMRSNTDEILLDGFKNTVYFNETDRTAVIKIPGTWEYDIDDMLMEEDDGYENQCPFPEKEILANNNDFIYRDVFHLSVVNKNYSYDDECKNNWYSNLNIQFPIGEGLLDFCHTDFTKGMDVINALIRFMQHFKDKIKERPKPEITNSDEAMQYEHNCFERTMSYISEYIYQSVYSGAFPPFILDVNEKNIKRYVIYLNHIQEEMQRRIEFVFDDEYYPEELSRFKPHERFCLYCYIYDIPMEFERIEHFLVTPFTDKTTLESSLIPMDKIIERLTSHVPSKEQSPLEKALNLEADTINVNYHIPKFMAVGYDCCTVHDMLELEFSKMLEYGIKLHKCKNCGRYFIIKGNYDAEYCDRIREGQTKNCQQIAAQKKYNDKLHNNEAIALFRKYYKRYYARSKVGTIKPDKFRQWNYQACEMRDKCLNNEISIKEFEDWLMGCFKNREKK